MPRARTGNVEPFKRTDGSIYYKARIRLADGTRWREDVPRKHAVSEESRELYALAAQQDEDATGRRLTKKRAALAAKVAQRDSTNGETCTQYRERVTAMQRAEGKKAMARESTKAWRKWVAEEIGALPIITPRDVLALKCENIRDRLDAAVRERIKLGKPHGISGKSAQNYWSTLRTTFKESMGSRDRTMRVRADDPTAGIKPPLKTRKPRKTFVYPIEAAKLLACEAVPIEWRITYALAFYLYVRPGELRALTLGDVDLVADVVHVRTSYNEAEKEEKAPKTPAGSRDVPIEPALRSLLMALKAHGQNSDLLAPLLVEYGESHDDSRAIMFCKHLKLADVDRPGLYEDTATTLKLNFRSCRDSGITWLALAKPPVPLVAIQRRAGHEHIVTTAGYVKQAEDIKGTIGLAFGPLPPRFLAAVQKRLGQGAGQANGKGGKTRGKRVGEAGFEPATTSTQSSCTTGLCDSPGNEGSLASRSGCAYGASEARSPSSPSRDLNAAARSPPPARLGSHWTPGGGRSAAASTSTAAGRAQ